MRILGVTLRDYRGTTDRSVAFAPMGVTVVEGPNEIGKSSIPEAIDHVFDDLDSSARRELQAVRPVDRDVGPDVTVEIETGPYAFSYRKRFLRQPITELRIARPRAEQLTGRAAHDRVQAILRETVDLALWKALRVQQGDLVGQARLARQTSLARALDRAAGATPAGDGEHSLFDAAHDEYLRFWTETGRRRQEELALERSIEDGAGEVERIRGAIEAVEADVESSLDLRTESQRLSVRRAELRSLVDEAQARVDMLGALEAGVATAAVRHEAARLAADGARAAAGARTAAVVARDEAEADRARREAAMAHDATSLEEARAAVQAADGTLAAARAERDRLRAVADAAEARRSRARDVAELAGLDDRYARGRAANAAMAAAADDAALPVTAEVLAEIRGLHRAVELARTRLDAARPLVRITARTALEGALDDGPLPLAPGAPVERRVERELRIDLPGIVSLVVTAGDAVEAPGAELARTEARLADALRTAGVGGLAEAEALHARREDAVRTIAEQGRIREGVLQGMMAREIAERILALRERLATHEPDAPTPSDVTGTDSDADLRGTLDDLAAAEQASRAAEQARETAALALLDIEVAAGRREAEMRMASDELARRVAALDEARDTASDDALAARVAEAEDAERRAAEELAATRDELARHGPDQARRELAGAKRTLEQVEVEQRLVQDRLLEVTTRLRDHGEDGLAEDLIEAQTTLDRLDAELRRHRAQAAARRLLFETLREERDRARRSYVGPLRTEIERLGRVVFGADFAVELDEASLEVVSRTQGGRTIPYRSLSVGAQEQVAIIGRLACARIVSGDGGVPVILDDALGNSDPVRLAAMGEVLAAAGEQCQVIVLTCQPERYAHVTDATLVRLV